MDGTIYKVLSKAALAEAKSKGRFEGSDADRRDGFIHLSAAGRSDLVLLAFEAASLGERLQWEPSRGGAVFPHLYGPLDLATLQWEEPLVLGGDGRHRLPARIAP
jgi:uncharacterized protein (DUF952 family)